MVERRRLPVSRAKKMIKLVRHKGLASVLRAIKRGHGRVASNQSFQLNRGQHAISAVWYPMAVVADGGDGGDFLCR